MIGIGPMRMMPKPLKLAPGDARNGAVNAAMIKMARSKVIKSVSRIRASPAIEAA